MSNSINKGLERQSQFLTKFRPQQPTLADIIRADKYDKQKKAFKALAASRGWSKKRLPSVQQMATEGGLLEIYNFFYHATSELVHFSPRIIYRMGWGEPPNFNFNMENYWYYYRAFCIFYGVFLTRKLIDVYSHAFNNSSEASICSLSSELDKFISIPRRFPEIITYEEMNFPVPKARNVIEMMRALAINMAQEEKDSGGN